MAHLGGREAPRGQDPDPGLIGHATNYVEHPELVADYIVKYAGLVGRENVIAGSDCGFSSTPPIPRVHPTVVWPKFRALAEGAALASKELLGLRDGRQTVMTTFACACSTSRYRMASGTSLSG